MFHIMTGLTSEENLIKSSGASAHANSLARIASQTVARSASTFEKMIMPLHLDASVINVMMAGLWRLMVRNSPACSLCIASLKWKTIYHKGTIPIILHNNRG